MSFTLELESALGAPADVVWERASTMEGVNAELAPWVRMTVPAHARDAGLLDVPLGQEAFVSVVLLLGFLPFDVHHLTLQSRYERGFDEESWTWMQRRWRHERRIEPTATGCTVIDRLVVQPRLLPSGLVKRIVHAVFASRHRRLRAWYPTGSGPSTGTG